jgi:hypothetical protein
VREYQLVMDATDRAPQDDGHCSVVTDGELVGAAELTFADPLDDTLENRDIVATFGARTVSDRRRDLRLGELLYEFRFEPDIHEER